MPKLGSEALASPETYEAKASLPKTTVLPPTPSGKGLRAKNCSNNPTDNSKTLGTSKR